MRFSLWCYVSITAINYKTFWHPYDRRVSKRDVCIYREKNCKSNWVYVCDLISNKNLIDTTWHTSSSCLFYTHLWYVSRFNFYVCNLQDVYRRLLMDNTHNKNKLLALFLVCSILTTTKNNNKLRSCYTLAPQKQVHADENVSVKKLQMRNANLFPLRETIWNVINVWPF